MLTQTGPTLLTLRRHTTQSQTLDAETRGHSTRLTEGDLEGDHGDTTVGY